MEKIKVALSSAVVEPYRTKLETLCDITPVGRALLGRKPTEDELLQQCMGHDIVYISDEVVTAKCIKAWQQSGMRLLGCGRGTMWIGKLFINAAFRLSIRPGATPIPFRSLLLG